MRRIKGFSLIELVVVILLIGILSAVAVPRLFSSTDKAHRAAIQNLQAQISSTLNVIAGEWLLNGSKNPSNIDGLGYRMTSFGYPDITEAATGDFPVGATGFAIAGTNEACATFLTKVVGLPAEYIGEKGAKTAEGSDATVGRTWVAEFLPAVAAQPAVEGGTDAVPAKSAQCVYHYNAGLEAAITYTPSEKFAVTTTGL